MSRIIKDKTRQWRLLLLTLFQLQLIRGMHPCHVIYVGMQCVSRQWQCAWPAWHGVACVAKSMNFQLKNRASNNWKENREKRIYVEKSQQQIVQSWNAKEFMLLSQARKNAEFLKRLKKWSGQELGYDLKCVWQCCWQRNATMLSKLNDNYLQCITRPYWIH